MATSKEALKLYFETNDTPTETQFGELIDAFVHIDDVETTITETPKDETNYPSNLANNRFWFNEDVLSNANNQNGLSSIKFYMAIAGNADIVYASRSGDVITIEKTDSLTSLSVGVYEHTLDFTGIDNTVAIYIGVKPGTTGGMKYSAGPISSFSIENSGETLVAHTFDFLYWGVFVTTTVSSLGGQEDKVRTATGTQDQTGFDLQAEIDDNDYIVLPPIDISVTTQITVPSDKTIIGVSGKTRIVLSTNINAFFIEDVNNVTLRDFTIVGDMAAVNKSATTFINTDADIESLNGQTNQRGIRVQGDCFGVTIDNIKYQNISGEGLYCRTAATSSHIGGVSIINNHALDCYLAFHLPEVGEYNLFSNLHANKCVIGCLVEGGNNMLSTCNFSSNRVNVVLAPDGNSAHGTIASTIMNHAGLYGIYAYDFTEGFCFSDCHVWDAPIKLENVDGFSWNGGMVVSEIIVNDVGFAKFHNVMFGSLYSSGTITTSGVNTVSMNDNFYLTGATTPNINVSIP